MTWQTRLAAVRRALSDQSPTPLEELLLPRSLDGQLARQLQPGPDVVPREAAALLLLYPQDDDLAFPLTVRSGSLPLHRGEVSLPGGAVDPEDAGPLAAALREANEELGIVTEGIEVLGMLTPFYIPPSNFRLTPVIGFTPAPPAISPSPDEVDAVFSVTIDRLLDPATVVVEEWNRRGMQLIVPFYYLNGHKVWGATAILLSELVARLRRQTAC